MDWKHEWKNLLWGVLVFLGFYFLPIERLEWRNAIISGVDLAVWYAREHLILCLIPALFIAGAIAIFINKEAVINLLGESARKMVALSIASISGTILAVCSCTVLPLFAGIYARGAGIGAATAFLYSGPAINVLAIILTARILGLKLGIARAAGAIVFSFLIGLIMDWLYGTRRVNLTSHELPAESRSRSRTLWLDSSFFLVMIAILVFVNWGKPITETNIWFKIYSAKWYITSLLGFILLLILRIHLNISGLQIILLIGVSTITRLVSGSNLLTFSVVIVGLSILLLIRKDEAAEWFNETYRFGRQILPLLAGGVLIAGFLLGNPVHTDSTGIIPDSWIASLVGGNSLLSNFLASIVGAFMYFATLTEVPIIQGLLASGMGQGPALALLLAGPALSLPNMLVINSVLGPKKTITFIILVVLMATTSGWIYGTLF